MFAVLVPVLCTLGEVDPEPVRPRQRADVLQVRRTEYSDYSIGTTTEDEALTDHQAARR